MTIKQFILIMILASVICWGVFAAVLYYVNPFQANFLGMGAFYSSLFLGMAGSLGLIGLAYRAKVDKEKPLFKLVLLSFRQSVFFAFILSSALYLQSTRLLTWWSALLLILTVTVIEMFFISAQERPYPVRVKK